MTSIPSGFSKVILNLHGMAGKEWLRQLDGCLAHIEDRWGIKVGRPLQPLAYSYVAPAETSDGGKVVIKLSFPDMGPRREAEALRLFDGRGSVQLLKADVEVSALLLERLLPGAPLSTVQDDEQATSVAIQVIQRLGAPVPETHEFRDVADRAADLLRLRDTFAGGTGPFPSRLVSTAEGLFRELIDSMDSPMVLHGDVHHDNILSAEREPWLAVDPKGIVGEPTYEVAHLLCNPMPHLLTRDHPVQLTRRRIDQLSDGLGFERGRIAGWGVAQAVLSAWWAYEDKEADWEYWLRCAELILRASPLSIQPGQHA